MLGAGGMGAVYLARDATLDREVAIKVILPNLAESEADRAQLLARFWREARISAGLKHRNVVEVLDFGEDAQHHMPFLVMELLVGRDFDGIIQRERRIAPRRAVHILAQVCRAIGAAHQKKQIHRDLKPSNIFILDGSEEPDFVKVVDFGLAREVADGAAPVVTPGLTQSGAIMGTVHYMAPEQVEAGRGEPIDHRCDIYALACVAYHALAGRPPFVGHSIPAILHAHLTKAAEPLHQIVPDVPRALSDVIAQSLAKRPGHRPQTMAHLREALERALRSTAQRQAEPIPAVTHFEFGNKTPITTPLPPAEQPEPGSPEAQAVPEAQEVPEPAVADPGPVRTPPLIASTTRHVVDALGDVRAMHPALALVADRIVLAYESDLAGSTQIYARVLAADLAQVDDLVALTAAPCSALAPAVVALANRMLLAWADPRSDDGGAAIYLRVDGVDRRPVSDERAITGRGLVASPAVCRLASGKVLVAWAELAPDPCVKVAIVSPDLQSIGPTKRLGTGSSPAVVASGTGAIVAWHDREPRVRVASLGLAEEVKLELPGAAFPALAAFRDGGVALAYWSSGLEDAAAIRVARIAPGGELGAALRVGAATRTPRPLALAVGAHHVVHCYLAPRQAATHLETVAVDLALTAAAAAIDLGLAKPRSRPALLAHGDKLVAAYAAPAGGIKLTELRAARGPA